MCRQTRRNSTDSGTTGKRLGLRDSASVNDGDADGSCQKLASSLMRYSRVRTPNAAKETRRFGGASTGGEGGRSQEIRSPVARHHVRRVGARRARCSMLRKFGF